MAFPSLTVPLTFAKIGCRSCWPRAGRGAARGLLCSAAAQPRIRLHPAPNLRDPTAAAARRRQRCGKRPCCCTGLAACHRDRAGRPWRASPVSLLGQGLGCRPLPRPGGIRRWRAQGAPAAPGRAGDVWPPAGHAAAGGRSGRVAPACGAHLGGAELAGKARHQVMAAAFCDEHECWRNGAGRR